MKGKYLKGMAFGVCSFLLFLLIPVASQAVTFPFSDDMESGGGSWTADSPWSQTVADSHSPITSWVDSFASYYADNADTSLTLGSPIDLTVGTNPQLQFRARYELEEFFDFVDVEISTNGGGSWTTLLEFTGFQTEWTRYQVDLGPWAASSNVLIRFRLVSDDFVVADGIYLDDVVIGNRPTAVTLSPLANATVNSLDLAWTANADPDFDHYEVVRSLRPGVDQDSLVVTSIFNPATTVFTDDTLASKTHYYYRIYTVNNLGIYAASNEAAGLTLLGLPYPFADHFEAGLGNWTAMPPWALDGGSYFSPLTAVTDSPLGDYGNDANLTLSSATNFNFTSAVNPQLTFRHKLMIAANDYAIVEASVNGSSWNIVGEWTGATIETWEPVQIDLSAYTGAPVVYLRFRLATDSEVVADGWWIDDVILEDRCNDVTLSPLTAGPSSVDLAWTLNTDPNFARYEVYRSETPGVDRNDRRVAGITNQATNAFTDTSAIPNSVFYYRVFVVSRGGAWSPGSNEETVTTQRAGFPWTEDFESGLYYFAREGDWAIAADENHTGGGSGSLTDSPGTDYLPSTDTSAYLGIDISTATKPVLTFWEKYATDTGDWMYIEISANQGTSWERIGWNTGYQPTWQQRRIDLTPWAGNNDLRLRFRLVTDAIGTNDGWYLDDFAVAETANPVPYPFFDDMETPDNWFGTFFWTTDESHTATHAWTESPWGGIVEYQKGYLTLSDTINLTGAYQPQLIFWYYLDLNWYMYLRPQISTDFGKTYTELAALDLNADGGWNYLQLDLAAYVDQQVRIRFAFDNTYVFTNSRLYIDDVSIQDQPEAPAMDSPFAPTSTTLELSWSENTDPDFDRYEIYRSASPVVNRADTLAATVTDPTTTSITDTGLGVGTRYHYAMYAVDSYGAYSLVSNEVTESTTNLGFPFTDNMNDSDNWTRGGNWGVVEFDGHTCLHDSPVGDYGNNSSSFFQSAFNLSLAQKPVLSFTHRYDLEDNNDWGRVEVSIDNGTSWTALYTVTGHAPGWENVAIDLTNYAGTANLLLRFRLTANESITFDGWYVEDVSIQETPVPTVFTLPFVDGFEAGLSQWIPSAWTVSSVAQHSGTYSITDSPHRIPFGDVTNVWNSIVTANDIDLTTATNPQLVFYYTANFNWYQELRVEISDNGGVSYTQIASLDINANTGGARFQRDLTAWVGKLVRVRLRLFSWYVLPGEGISLDDFSIQERPDAVALNSLTPGITSMNVEWAQSAEPDFMAYHIFRSTTPGVDAGDSLVADIYLNTTTSLVDSGLATGTGYYYVVFVEDSFGAWSLTSNQLSAFTLGINFPFSDNMNIDNGLWSAGGNWAVESFDGHTCWSDSPGGPYPCNYDASLLASFDLSLAQRPSLRFTQRHDFENSVDYAFVEVSINNGANWTRIWGVSGTDPLWSEEKVDLTPWAGYNRVIVRFRSTSNGCSIQGEGLYLDDLYLEESNGTLLPYPFYEDFESGLDNWLPAAWDLNPVKSLSPTHGLDDSLDFQISPYTENRLVTRGAIDLTLASAPQLVINFINQLNWYEYLLLEVSTDGGLTYDQIGSMDVYSASALWQSRRYDLSAYAGDTVRLRVVAQNTFVINGGVIIDDLFIDEKPADILLDPPANVGQTSLDLSFSESAEPGFDHYEIRGATTAGVTAGSPLLATIDDAGTTSINLPDLASNRVWYFRVFVVTANGLISDGSNEVLAETLLNAYPFADDFELPAETGEHWEFTGSWASSDEQPLDGARSLSDSPAGAYPVNSNYFATLAIDLQAAARPVLEYDEIFDFQPSNDYGLIQVSTDNGATWLGIESVSGTIGAWRHRVIDLSAFAGDHDFKLRFSVTSDGSDQRDGWHLDNLQVHESGLASAYPFRDDFETELPIWASAWERFASDAWRGNWSIRDNLVGKPDGWSGVTYSALATSDAFSLATAVNPILTFWDKRDLNWYQYTQVEVSINGGRTWTVVWVRDINQNNSGVWSMEQVDLSAYAGNPLFRLRFNMRNDWGGFTAYGWNIDQVGLGEPEPDAPTLLAPASPSYVNVLQPTLSLTNGLDYQWEAVTYTFEVYDDPGLSNLITSVTTIPEGAGVTSWQVDVPLVENQTYYWRARGTDSTAHNSTWMTTSSFTVSTNQPPTAPAVLGPDNGAAVGNDNTLWWTASTDPDPLDVITYTVQVDDNSNFGSPEITETLIPIELALAGDLSGIDSLVSGTTYYWRVRADDNHGGHSAFTDGTHNFRYLKSPQVISANPPTVAAGPAVPVTLTGAYFAATPAVAASGAGISVSSVTFVNDTTLNLVLAITPAAAGPHDFTVTNLDGGQGTGYALLTVSAVPDRDGDGLPDAWEDDPAHSCMDGDLIDNLLDYDLDTLDNETEYGLGSNPCLADTDADGLDDNDELTVSLTDLLDEDTDDDGLNDGTEFNVILSNPLAPDTDGDGLGDGYEENTSNTDSTEADSDLDGVSDGGEVADGTDPNNPASFQGELASLINYQGRLANAVNAPVQGDTPMTFRLFAGLSGGATLWEESATVPVANGIYNVLLGGGTPIPASVVLNPELYLEVAVGGETLAPRQKISSTLYARNADRIGGQRLETGSRELRIPLPSAEVTVHVAFERSFTGPPRMVLSPPNGTIGTGVFFPVRVFNLDGSGFDVTFRSADGQSYQGSAQFGYQAVGE